MFRNDLIKERLEGTTLYAVAVKAGVTPGSVANVRDGENVSIKTLAAVAEALDIEMCALFTFPRNAGTRGKGQPEALSIQN